MRPSLRPAVLIAAFSATAIAVAGCDSDHKDRPKPEPTLAPLAALCAKADQHQQLGIVLIAHGRAARRIPAKDAELSVGIGTLSDGLCLDGWAELTAKGWGHRTWTLRAVGNGTDGHSVTYTVSGPAAVADSRLFVPIARDGKQCVRVSAVVRAVSADPPHQHAEWRGSGVYGPRCKVYLRSRHHGQ